MNALISFLLFENPHLTLKLSKFLCTWNRFWSQKLPHGIGTKEKLMIYENIKNQLRAN